MAAVTTAHLSDRPVETCSCSNDEQDELLIYLDASTLSRNDLLCPWLFLMLASNLFLM